MPGLFSPLTVRGHTLKNRIVLPPMNTRLAPPDGSVSEGHLAHYSARARAGVGLIIVEGAYVAPAGRHRPTQLSACADACLPGLRRLAAAVHAAGAAVCLQINHAGAKTSAEVIGQQPAGPSDLPLPGSEHAPRPLTRAEIAGVVADFAAAAARAVAAGFDAVELHGCHGYLLSQFASPLTNRREDEYGGDRQRRFRFPLEVTAAVRERMGRDCLLFYRLGADDLLPGGLTPDDACAVAPRLLAAGADVIDVSSGVRGDGRGLFDGEGWFVSLAEQVKQASGATVVGVGGIVDPRYADRVVREGRVDLVAVGRAQLNDPQWATKAAELLGTEQR